MLFYLISTVKLQQQSYVVVWEAAETGPTRAAS